MPHFIDIETTGPGLFEITAAVEKLTRQSGIKAGLAHVFVQHTSASLLIQENADPDVQRDLIAYFDRLAPEGGDYLHVAEGPDDMPAHLKAALTATSLTIPIAGAKLLLGTWQGVYLFEHRRAPHQRRIIVSVVSEA